MGKAPFIFFSFIHSTNNSEHCSKCQGYEEMRPHLCPWGAYILGGEEVQ